jgi:hypothetical protein
MAHPAGAWRSRTGRLDRDGAVPGTAAEARSAAVRSGARTVRSWPLLVLAAPAAAEVWSGWVGIAQKTGFGLVRPLPGIWPALHIDTAITLPVGVEAYAAYALRAWLARDPWITSRTRRFAKCSAICSFALGMAGQIAYHLLAQAGTARAPWPVTTVVSCLPVLVLAMGTALAHMLRADASTAAGGPDGDGTAGPATPRSPAWSAQDQAGRAQDQTTGQPASGSGPPARVRTVRGVVRGTAGSTRIPALAQISQARLIAGRLTAAGRPVSRRALRGEGVKGSNQALNALARRINAELADAAACPAGPEGGAPRSQAILPCPEDGCREEDHSTTRSI